MDVSDRSLQPDIEEVGEVRIRYVVVVGRVCETASKKLSGWDLIAFRIWRFISSI